MRRYWMEKESINAGSISIRDEKFKHIVGVCRQGLGSKFEVIADGKAYFVEMIDVQKKEATAKIVEMRKIKEMPRPHIHLCLSLPKFNKLDEIVEKSVELGVSTIHPFTSEFSFIRSNADGFQSRRKRLEKIVESATQQSGRGDLMSIEPLVDLKTLLSTFNRKADAAGLFPYEGEGVQNIKDALPKTIASNPSEVWVFIGSEGGFSHEEVREFQQVGLPPVTLGEQILRVETACVAVVSILKYHMGQFA
ncbi:MAG: 16S rRNA (uracil(1498)-N(3))-methyltransferase [Bdellovibrionales bacterium]|nr:16S rRNA (uracil(1498)-N(3))-methyltransferase [Bdellovibrionales bacterium]